MVNKPLYQNRDWLYKRYIEERRTSTDIAKQCGCDLTTITRWLRKYGIKIRDRSARQLFKADAPFYLDPKWLKEMYWDKGLSLSEIGALVGRTPSTIYTNMQRRGIPRRSQRAANSNSLNLTAGLKELLDGLLLGDGCIENYGSSANYHHTESHQGYLEELSQELASWGIEQTGSIRGYVGHWGKGFLYASRRYPSLREVHARWYRPNTDPNDWRIYRKIVPRDLKLTPVICLHWWVGDGCLQRPRRGKPSGLISTQSFLPEENDWLVTQLGKLGFTASRQPAGNRLYISTRSLPGFLQYIGPCPKEIQPYYGYKWAI